MTGKRKTKPSTTPSKLKQACILDLGLRHRNTAPSNQVAYIEEQDLDGDEPSFRETIVIDSDDDGIFEVVSIVRIPTPTEILPSSMERFECPICSKDLSCLSGEDRNFHANDCCFKLEADVTMCTYDNLDANPVKAEAGPVEEKPTPDESRRNMPKDVMIPEARAKEETLYVATKTDANLQQDPGVDEVKAEAQGECTPKEAKLPSTQLFGFTPTLDLNQTISDEELPEVFLNKCISITEADGEGEQGAIESEVPLFIDEDEEIFEDAVSEEEGKEVEDIDDMNIDEDSTFEEKILMAGPRKKALVSKLQPTILPFSCMKKLTMSPKKPKPVSKKAKKASEIEMPKPNPIVKRRTEVPFIKKLEFPVPYSTPEDLPSSVTDLLAEFSMTKLGKVDAARPQGDLIISVDAFNYAPNSRIFHYFLTHFHADHYMGICKSWANGLLYCSEITDRLVRLRYPTMDHTILRPLPMNKKIELILPDGSFNVTLIDANHCPGAVLFLFEYTRKEGSTLRMLHCGDFRVCKEMIENKLLANTKIDKCYLDTTFLNPLYCFPKQKHAISVTCEFFENLCNQETYSRQLNFQKKITDFFTQRSAPAPKSKYLVLLGTYTIGKERIAFEIARTLNSKVYADGPKRKVLDCLEDAEISALVTDDPHETFVHLVSMSQFKNLDVYFKNYASKYEKAVVVRPTGWSFSADPVTHSVDTPTRKGLAKMSKAQILNNILYQQKSDQQFTLEKLESQFFKRNSPTLIFLQIPYSEHSSFKELAFFSILLDIGQTLPTVNLHSLDSIREMNEWIKEWEAFRARNGRTERSLTIEDF